jgi:hypothetical protein
MTHILYRHSVLFCGVFCALVVWAFWPRYFSRPLNVTDLHIHAHVVPLALWCGLLVVQAYAIRTRQYWIHKRLGPVSYILMAAISITTLGLFHRGMRGLQIMEHHAVNLAFNLSTLAAFVLLYGLAMSYRRDPATHLRYMLCTTLPLCTAITPRLITDSRMLVDVAMRTFGPAAIGQASLIPADALALGMAIWDWRANRRLNVFPVAFGLLLTIHLATVTLYRVPLWQSFVTWFAGLPLP